jgi:hypothetical protein
LKVDSPPLTAYYAELKYPEDYEKYGNLDSENKKTIIMKEVKISGEGKKDYNLELES